MNRTRIASKQGTLSKIAMGGVIALVGGILLFCLLDVPRLLPGKKTTATKAVKTFGGSQP